MVKRGALIAIALASILFFQYVIVEQTTEAAGKDIDSSYLGVAPGRYNSIKAADVDKDGRMEIVFGGYNGIISEIKYKDGGYHDEWQSPQIGQRAWGVCVADINKDGRNEILAGDGDGVLYVYNGTSHNLIWKAPGLGRDVSGIRVGDVNGDGINEVVVGTGYKTDIGSAKIYVFNSTTIFSGNSGLFRKSLKHEFLSQRPHSVHSILQLRAD